LIGGKRMAFVGSDSDESCKEDKASKSNKKGQVDQDDEDDEAFKEKTAEEIASMSIFTEPSNCTDIISLLEEINKSKDKKPVEIFLDHCSEFSKKNIDSWEVKQTIYKFKKDDFLNN